MDAAGSGRAQYFDCLIGLLQRVDCQVGHELRTDHGGRKAAQVDARVSEFLRQLRGDARRSRPMARTE